LEFWCLCCCLKFKTAREGKIQNSKILVITEVRKLFKSKTNQTDFIFAFIYLAFWPLSSEHKKWPYSSVALVFRVSNGHSPQIRQNGELLARMCRGESHFSQRWQMSNVSECIESGEMVGKCRANVSSPGKVGRPMSAQAR
jgi:hypothetical protein